MEEKNYLQLEGESAKDFAVRLQGVLDEYKKSVLDLKTQEELEAEEKKCIEDLEKYDKYLENTQYHILNEVTYDGTRYSKKDIAAAILYFLNKNEVKWDFTLGLYELYKLWRGELETLTFRQMDSTLRVLDQVQFKGFKEWKDILAINEYFKANHEQYSIDTAGTIYLSQRHNAVMEQMELVKTVNSQKPVDKEPVEKPEKPKTKKKAEK